MEKEPLYHYREDKTKAREEIDRKTKEFLANGGEVKRVEQDVMSTTNVNIITAHRRNRAIEMHKKGFRIPAISKQLMTSRSNIEKWISEMDE